MLVMSKQSAPTPLGHCSGIKLRLLIAFVLHLLSSLSKLAFLPKGIVLRHETSFQMSRNQNAEFLDVHTFFSRNHHEPDLCNKKEEILIVSEQYTIRKHISR